MTGTVTEAGTELTMELTKQLSSCLKIDTISGNQIYLRNCGKGVITNNSLSVFIDDKKVGHSTLEIGEKGMGTINISGLWQFSFDQHNLKITNGATFVQALIELQPNKDGLAGGWDFDEGQGTTAYDESGNENILFFVGLPLWVEGKFGKGLEFDGTNNLRRDVGNNMPLGASPRTLSAWIKPISYPDSTYNGIVVHGGHGSMLSMKNDGRLSMAFWENDAYQTIGPSAILNNWNYVQFTYNGGNTVKFYMNGNFVQESTLSVGPPDTQVGSIRIASTDDPGRRFDGLIDEVRIWNRALTPDQTVVMKRIG